MSFHTLGTKQLNELRVLVLEFFEDKTQTLPDLMTAPQMREYAELLGEGRMREFVGGMCDPAGLMVYNGRTRGRQYRTTALGRFMIHVYKGRIRVDALLHQFNIEPKGGGDE